MSGMRCTRPLRQLVSGIAAVMMVLCQGAAMAAACAPMAPRTAQGAGAAPCHDAGGAAANDNGGSPCSWQCPASHASSESSKAGAGTAIDLPLLTAHAVAAPLAPRCAAPHETRLHHAASPPLPIVLCRLLN
jgi:hypothetical protein